MKGRQMAETTPRPVKKIIDDIIKAEEEAQRIVDEARDEARRLKSAADAEINTKIDTARMQNQQRLREHVETARREAKEDYDRDVSDAQDISQRYIEDNRKKINSVVEQIVELVITPYFKKR